MTDKARNAYQILGVPREATVETIRSAFRMIALEKHPDVVPADKRAAALEAFLLVQSAYELLTNSQRRNAYDSDLQRGVVGDLASVAASQLTPLEGILARVDKIGISAAD